MNKTILPKDLKSAFDEINLIFMNKIPISEIDFENFILEEVMGYGTTKDELIKNITEFKNLVHNMEEQGKDLNLSFTQTPVHHHISKDGKTALFIQEFELTMQTDEENRKFLTRVSFVFEKITEPWKLVHFHFSVPVDTDNDTWHADEWQREKAKLEKLVNEQTADLQEKNRELEIEAALERVRAQSMAMHRSDELTDVVKSLYTEFRNLVPDFHSVNIQLNQNEPRGLYFLTSVGENIYPKIYFLPDPDLPITNKILNALQSPEVGVVDYSLEKKESDAFFEEVFKVLPVPDERKELIHQAEGLVIAGYFHKHSGIDILRYNLKPFDGQAKNIVKRFAATFEQAYVRFLDLQKAESQAREAEVELSLERIRAKVSAMQESGDLQDLMVDMRTEFTSLGHEAHYFWYMRWLEDTYQKAMTSGDGSKIGMVMTLPRKIHSEIESVARWEKSDDPYMVLAMDPETAVDYVDKMITWGDFEQVDPQAPSLDDVRHIGGLTFIMARTSQGEIGYSLPGVVPEPPKEAIDTLIRFARVFDLAYQRFEDLKEAERQARLIREERDRLENALTELHDTQDQLIQQEKLASLGQLTAGIAHEIKNPLNFVNNFSDLSVELVKEALEELKLYPSESKEVTDILHDISANLMKVHEHGSRADNIVKSMLQHSRGGSGKKEPTQVNDLLKEYATLAFHGMRASKDPIDVDIKLELDDQVGKLDLISEDFSRVIVNLCNNAFDAMREKGALQNGNTATYKPALTVRSWSENNQVLIEIEDNGPGIPYEIQDKILQPFFTTKKGTQGTGLGLSITNDIIKAHGGTLAIGSPESGGSTFTINIPIPET